MSSIATTWAWSQVGLNNGQKFLLIALAEHADEKHSCFPSVRRLAEMTCTSERQVRRQIQELRDADLIEVEHDVRENGSQKSSRYWLRVPVKMSTNTLDPGDEPEDKMSEVTEVVDKMSPLEEVPNNKPTSRSKTTSSARTIARAKPASDEDLTDPDKAVWGLQPGELTAVVAPRRSGRSKLKTRALSAGGNLARDFASRARKARPDTPGDTNQGALSGQFNRWMKDDDLDAGVIRGMMDTYFSDERLWDAYRPMWVDFLNKRARLASLGKKEAQLREDQANRHNADYWTEVTTEDEHRHDASYWESV